MIIKIPITDLSKEIQELYNQNKLEHFAIDYQYNNLLAEVEQDSIHLDEKWKEVEVFDFTKYLKMDNRFNTYEVELKDSEIIIQITVI